MQEAYRNVYYTNNFLSISKPLEVLTVMFITMDRVKTTSPCFANRIKAKNGFFKLHVSVTSDFGNNFIAYSERCSVFNNVILGDMDSHKIDYL